MYRFLRIFGVVMDVLNAVFPILTSLNRKKDSDHEQK